MKKCNKNYRQGLTLFEVIIYLALASVFLSVALPTSMNILFLTQSQQFRSEQDQQFVTLIRSIEGLVRSGQVGYISNFVARYGDVISSSSISTMVDSQTGQPTLFLSFLYNNQVYNYVYVY